LTATRVYHGYLNVIPVHTLIRQAKIDSKQKASSVTVLGLSGLNDVMRWSYIGINDSHVSHSHEKQSREL